MRPLLLFLVALPAISGIGGRAANAQSALDHFREHNQNMTALQPRLVTPLVTPDPRLIQYVRFSVSHQYTPSRTETINFGNCRGGGIVVGRRFEFDWIPPAFIEHNSKAKDGAGDTSLVAKVRIASGNAEHGNYVIAAMLNRTFATGSHTNGALTGSYAPTISGAWTHGRFDVISGMGGALPTGKVNQQGRSVAWNSAIQAHAARSVWFELEDNATYFRGGAHDSKMQNFVLPAALYVIRSREWKPIHPYFIVDAGMQIATSRFHTYNHNLITEVRMLF